jgi:DNA-binding NtrC family response regulator
MEITVSDSDKGGSNCPGEEQTMGSLERLLFVDDDMAILDGYKFIFESEGFKVDLAVDIASMMKLLTENNYDMIIMDYHLKGEKGMDVINEIYQKKPGQKIVFISGQKNADEELQRLGIPIAGFFLKPLKVDDLLEFITAKLHETY